VNTRPIIKILLLAYIAIMVVPGVQAQKGTGYFYQAQNLYKNKNYYGASVVYEKYLATEKNSRPRSTPFAIEKKVKGKTNLDPHQEAVYELATCYRMINDYQKAEKYYKEAVGFPEKAYPDARYWYAVTLRANQQYAEALVQITAYLDKHTELNNMLVDADRQLEDLKFIQLQSERVNDQFSLQAVKGKDSSSGYALVQRADGVVFTAITEETDKTSGKWYMNSLFESMNTENPLEGADPIEISSEPGVHDGMASFTHDGKTMFFTRWTKSNGQVNAAIYITRWKNKGWTKPVKAPDPINMDGSNSAQPCLTADGRFLLFSSDRPGGEGGYDLWATYLDSLQGPIQIHNLGNVINSAGDEEAPYMHDKTRTLIFSSNGRVGMGGFDIYYARGNYNLSGWEKPLNAGAPLNSSKDDLYYTSTDEDSPWNTGWISSDRGSVCCLALYAVRENNTQYLQGTVTDCKTHQALVNVELTVTDLRHPDRMLGKYKADTAGRYAIELHNSAHFKISAKRTGYDPASTDYNLPTIQGRDSLVDQSICMNSIVYPEKEVDELMKALTRSSRLGNFGYKKAILNDSAHDNLDSLAVILRKFPNMVILVEGYTDAIGGVKYNLGLAQKRVNATIRYLLSIGVSPKQLQGRAMGKCCPIAPETIDGKDNPAGREINRRVEYKVLKH
jgi:OOP family OmpA-OmpF porin